EGCACRHRTRCDRCNRCCTRSPQGYRGTEGGEVMAVSTYTKSGAKAATPAKLDKAVFGVQTDNHELLKLAYHAYLANGRENYAVVKTRGLVRGGGRKPWRQKGTG